MAVHGLRHAAARPARTAAAVALALAAALTLSGCLANGSGAADANASRSETVDIAGETFQLELAVDEASRTRGMSGRESFPDGGGMLFVFPDVAVREFWMFECLIPIDLIFLDARGYVTAVHEMPVEPPQREDESDFAYQQRLPMYSSRHPARFAIELPAGSIDRLGVEVEDRIELDLARLKALAR